MKNLCFLLLFLSPLFLAGQVDSVLFDFNNLSPGDLSGQNGWQTINHTSGPSDFIISVNVGAVVTPDGSNGAYYNSGGPGYGRTATQKDFGDLETNFENGGIIELEAEIHRNHWGEFIGIGFDADADGIIAPGLISEPLDNGVQLHLAGVNFPQGNKIVTPNGTVYNYEFNNESWVKYKLWIDLNAFGGEGQAALFYKTPPFDMDWIAVTDIQGVNLGLTPGSGDANDPEMWDGLYFHSQGGTGFFDNILLRRPGGTSLTPQFIDFTEIEKQLTTVGTVQLEATADSGLPVEFEILSGPATLNGDVVTLTGAEGIVEVQATQPGDATWAVASPVIRSFEIVDPALHFPTLIVRNPVDQNKVLMPELSPFMMVASVSIAHPDVLSITDVSFTIDGQDYSAKDWETGYFTIWWTPPAYSDYMVSVKATSSGGPVTTETAAFEVDDLIEDMTITILDSERAGVADTNIVFPSFVGAYENVKINLTYDCPPDGCEPWDRINQQEVQAPTGAWVGFMRYITPYGVACSDEQDITDYMSLFQGMVRIKLPYEWRSEITLTLEYTAGEPTYKYSWVDEVWDNTYNFGDMANLQPLPIRTIDLDPIVEDVRLKVINSGHGWGDNNTGNAAEFYHAIHNIRVDNEIAFNHDLWEDCNPNPTGCSPQNGTWYFDRAGWCPGALVDIVDFNFNEYLNTEFELQYELFPGYKDLCHPNNPNCMSGLTCPDCSASFNPHLVMDAHMVYFSNTPFEGVITEIETIHPDYELSIIPNPSNGQFEMRIAEDIGLVNYRIINSIGKLVHQESWNTSFDKTETLNLSHLAKGMYWVLIETGQGLDMEKIIIQ